MKWLLVAFSAALAMPAAAARQYALEVKVVDAAGAQVQCADFPVAGVHCDPLPRARQALRDAAARTFTSAAARASVQLSVHDIQVELRPSGGGYTVAVAVHTRIAFSNGGDGLIRSDGEALIGDATPSAIEAGIDRAVDDAFSHFVDDVGGNASVAAALQGQGIEPSPSLVWPPRHSARIFLAAGGGEMNGGDDNTGSLFAAHLGFEIFRVSLQLYYSHSSVLFLAARSPARSADLEIADIGVDLAYALRLTPFLDLRAGPGFHHLSGSATNGAAGEYGVGTPTVFGELLFAPLALRNGLRFTLSFEGRKYFDTTVAPAGVARTVTSADFSFSAMIGIESPVGSDKSP
jgi:hypothetical protein